MTNKSVCPWTLLYEVAEELYNKRQYQETDPWPLLRAAQELLKQNLLYNNHGLMNSVDTALGEHETDHAVKCEFCKGSGKVPYKKPWSPRSVLGNENE